MLQGYCLICKKVETINVSAKNLRAQCVRPVAERRK